eukprot:6190307-Pleurochrysis_carterae.AAC.2
MTSIQHNLPPAPTLEPMANEVMLVSQIRMQSDTFLKPVFLRRQQETTKAQLSELWTVKLENHASKFSTKTGTFTMLSAHAAGSATGSGCRGAQAPELSLWAAQQV